MIQICLMASVIKLQFVLSQNIGLQYQEWSVYVHCPYAVLFPNSENGQRLCRKSQEHPVLCTFPIIVIYFVRLIPPVNSSVPKDEFFAEEWVLVVQMTDKIHFKGLEDPVENADGSDNSNASYCWILYGLHGPSVFHLIFTKKKYWSDQSGIVLSTFQMWKLRFKEVKWRQSKLPGFLITPNSLLNYSLSVQHTEFIHFQLLSILSSWKKLISWIGAMNNCLLVSGAQWMPIKIQGLFFPLGYVKNS